MRSDKAWSLKTYLYALLLFFSSASAGARPMAMVVSAQALASRAGMQVSRAGGNAVDAAVADKAAKLFGGEEQAQRRPQGMALPPAQRPPAGGLVPDLNLRRGDGEDHDFLAWLARAESQPPTPTSSH